MVESYTYCQYSNFVHEAVVRWAKPTIHYNLLQEAAGVLIVSTVKCPDPCVRCIAEQNLQYQEEAVNRGFCPTVEAREAMRADPGGSNKTLKKRATAIVLENDNESRAVGLHSLEKHMQGHMMQACSTESIGKLVQGLPPDQLRFILNATMDTLPHNSKLFLWKRNHTPPVHYVESNRR